MIQTLQDIKRFRTRALKFFIIVYVCTLVYFKNIKIISSSNIYVHFQSDKNYLDFTDMTIFLYYY